MMSIGKVGQEAGDSSKLQVAICAATCRRPAGLRRLLDGIARLEFTDAVAPQITIIVVDNDSTDSAKQLIEKLRKTIPWPITYVHEPVSGIPHARNAALDAVDERVDWICFIDDDERPQPNWLNELLDVQRSSGADVVAGPVEPAFDEDVPAWARKGGFFNRTRRATGTAVDRAYTGNVLFRAELSRRLNLRFDARFAGTMGEDREFFHRMKAAGGRIVWANDAVVVETIPASRAQARPLVGRMYEIGRSTATIELLHAPGSATRMKISINGLIWIKIGLGTLPVGLLARRWAVRSLQWLAYGVGLFTGLHSPRT